MKKEKIGLLIGRFQPLHLGHLYLMKKSFEFVDKLIIGIGSANRQDEENPWSFEVRRKMLAEVLDKEFGRKHGILGIVAINDYLESDEVWYRKAIENIKSPIDVVIGNNEWVNGIFEKAGYKILRLGFYKKYLYEGKKIRRLMRNGGNWQERVPKDIVPSLHGYIVDKKA